jgi:hypothetical protein
MTRTARLVVAIAVAIALGSAVALGAQGATSLRISVRADANAPARVATLRCNPTGGTLSNAASACRRLAALGRKAFAPTPRGMACTQIYGGPQTAIVSGTLDGARVWARFTRRDGCEIARWKRVAFMLQAA